MLPFKPLLAATRDEALELGMTDTLIARLSGIEDVTVRPLSSVRRYGELEQDALAAGRELHVASVLDGSIQRKGNRLRVTVRLINVADGSQLWSERFDEPQDDVFAVQDSIADRVIGALALRLTDSDRRRMDRYRTRDAQANHLYVLGRGLCIPVARRTWIGASSISSRAVARDPDYALLHAALADCYAIKSVFAGEPPLPLFARAREAATRGAGARPRSGGRACHAWTRQVAIRLRLVRRGRGVSARDRARPQECTAHYRLALLRGFAGRFDEGLAEMEIARQLEPLWAPAAANHAWLLVLAGRYAEGEAEARRAIEIDPDFAHSRSVLGRALLGQQRYDEALEAFRSRKGPGPGSYADVAVTLAAAGRLAEARQDLDGLLVLSRQQLCASLRHRHWIRGHR